MIGCYQCKLAYGTISQNTADSSWCTVYIQEFINSFMHPFIPKILPFALNVTLSKKFLPHVLCEVCTVRPKETNTLFLISDLIL